ncbi:N-6 DNA methylase [Rhodoferax sp. 4810]|nr:N-6 DNA methylase [Rhodoferax jenense]
MPRDLFTQPLFSPKLVKSRFPAQAIPVAHHDIITGWTGSLKSGLNREKEESIRPAFLQHFFVEMLGYQLMGGLVWTLHHEKGAASGSADAALGTFTNEQRQVVAPFELKGPKTGNLDALMPGRHKSPVQQAWEYAMDLPGSQFVLVSNCVEVRLYALGYGRAAYECWQVQDLLQPEHYASFTGLLKADNLLSGATATLLKDNAALERDITQALYTDYKTLRQELILGLHHQNPAVAFADLVRHAQKLIDRLLFIAFAESRNLLPKGSIAKAASHIDPYNPNPRWVNFVALFRAVDKGNPYLKIPPYNGGLFAPDAGLEQLKVSDKLVQSFLKLAGYDYAQEVSVTVLGRIFEQSISDLEHIASLGDISTFALTAQTSAPGSKKSVDGKRKRDGVVYTPDHITRFIVEQAVTPTLLERFFKLHDCYFVDSCWRKPDKGWRQISPKSVADQDITEYQFWLAWQGELTRFRVCDPACGSGAFLVAAFDVLKEAYTQLHLKLRELAPEELLTIDISHEILTNNLFGVDINAESIEITKLSLWLKTAEQGKQLDGLEANFYQGNSLLTDPALDPLAFDWRARFAEVFTTSSIAVSPYVTRAGAGFDVILGNPPYVRQELFSDLKPYLQAHYAVFHGGADLFSYFFELGLSLLKDGGRLGFISSSSFFKTSSGEPLRRHLRQACQLEVLVDFGDWQVFDGVTTYPAVLVAQKTAPDDGRSAHFLQLSGPVPDLSAFFADNKQTLNLAQLSPQPAASGSAAHNQQGQPGQPPAVASDASPGEAQDAPQTQAEKPVFAPEWQLEGVEAAALRAKLTHGHPTLKQAVGSPLYGIKTGLNEAFVIDRAMRDRLVFADGSSADLFKPFLKGDDIERWHLESQDLWLILLPKGWTRAAMNAADSAAPDAYIAWAWLQKQHPVLAAWLAPFATAAAKRTDQGDYWWELRACAYYDQFAQPKIFYPDICVTPSFCLDQNGMVAGNTGYFLPVGHPWLVAIMNAKALWFLIAGMSTHIRGGYRRMFTQHIETLPIPNATPEQQAELGALADAAASAAQQRLAAQRDFTRRITDLLPSPPPKGALTTPGDKLGHWWLLPDFKTFQAEVQKRFKADIALRERNDWQALFEQERTRVHQLGANIAAVERSIDTIVYDLFGLSATEVALIERAVGQNLPG